MTSLTSKPEDGTDMPHTVPGTPKTSEQITGPARYLTHKARTNKADGSESLCSHASRYALHDDYEEDIEEQLMYSSWTLAFGGTGYRLFREFRLHPLSSSYEKEADTV